MVYVYLYNDIRFYKLSKLSAFTSLYFNMQQNISFALDIFYADKRVD